MTIKTEEQRILRAAMLNAPALAEIAGLSVHTVRAVLNGKRAKLYPRTRARLAAALRAHSLTLASLADELDAPAPP